MNGLSTEFYRNAMMPALAIVIVVLIIYIMLLYRKINSIKSDKTPDNKRHRSSDSAAQIHPLSAERDIIITQESSGSPKSDVLNGFIDDLKGTNSLKCIDQGMLMKLANFHTELYSIMVKAGDYEDPIKACIEIDNAYTEWEKILSKPWLKDKTTVAFMGRFSAGKSSVINSLLGDKLLPVDVTPTTAVSAYISFATDLAIKAVDNDDNIKGIRPEIFNSLTKDAVQGFPIARLIKHFVIEYKNESLKDKSILDTHGYDSLDETDKNRAMQVITESKAVFWVMDINDGDISKDALNFIKGNLQNIPLHILLNKADTKSPNELKKVLAKVEATLKKADIKFENCELYSSRDRRYTERLSSIISSIQSNNVSSYKEVIIEVVDGIINRVNEYVAEYKKDIIELEKIKDKAESDKKAIIDKNNHLVGQPIDVIFPQIESGYFVELKIKNQEAFLNRFNKIISTIRDDWENIGFEEYRITSVEDTIKSQQEQLQQKEELRKEAQEIKNKAKKLFGEVL